jgi:Zn-dependent protease
MPGRTIHVGTFAGIPLGIHPLWPVIVAVITLVLATGWYPAQVDGIAPAAAWALGALSALLLFASVVAHEYGHALVARRHDVEVEGIDLWLLGGVAKIRGTARRPQDELAYAVAGPAVTAVIAAVSGGVLLLLPTGTALYAVVAYQALVNVVLLLFNLLPAFPLDGGRVLHALLWRRSDDRLAATVQAARVGRAFGFGFIALGVLQAVSGYPGGLWLALIGWFVVMAGGAEALHAEVQEVFTGVRASELMSAPAVCLPLTATAADAVDLVVHEPHPAFPALDDGRVAGFVRVSALEQIPPAERGSVLIAALVEREPSLLVAPDADIAALLDEPAFTRLQRAAVVDDDRRPIGVVSITDVQRAFDVRQRLTVAGAA